jgi:hypothetical protein
MAPSVLVTSARDPSEKLNACGRGDKETYEARLWYHTGGSIGLPVGVGRARQSKSSQGRQSTDSVGRQGATSSQLCIRRVHDCCPLASIY